MKPTEKEILEKIARKFARFEYIGGYTGSGGYLYLMCKDCGTVFRFNAQITRPSNKVPVMCPNCHRMMREKERQEKQAHNKQMKELKKELKFVRKFNEQYGNAFEYISGYKSDDLKAKILIRCKACGTIKERSRRKIFEDENIACAECDNNRKGVDVGVCEECGREYKRYSPQQVLCRDCHDERERIKRNTMKRLREAKARQNGKVDYSITLTRLMERDNHICQICGREVDETDYVYVNDTFIAGNNYPSIDHIVPLSKGGVHQWDNVQLAHRICNSIKCDREDM